LDYDELANLTDGYSGAEITLICKEAAMMPLRELFSLLEIEGSFEDGEMKDTFDRKAVSMRDLKKAIGNIKSTCDDKLKEKYQKWQNDYGSV
jgi:katanin p60 ATPase-containing subunit A1